MLMALVVAWKIRTDWAIVGSWGLGASVGAVAGFAQTRLRPSAPKKAWSYWRRELWPFGRWLFGGSIAYSAGAQGSVLLIAALLGPTGLGGLRAVQTVFAPLSLLSAAIALPALPAMTRRLTVGAKAASWFAVRLSGLLIVLTTAYVVPVSLAGSEVLKRVFGASFQTYDRLVLPIVIQQIVTAGGGGFMLLLLAKRRGRAIFTLNVVIVPVSLASIAVGDAVSGLVGVAWGLGIVALLSVAATGVLAVRLAPREDGA